LADRDGPSSIAATVRRYAERGVCHLIEADPSGYLQGEWITRMARMAATDFGADWVINADIDEFYWPETGTLKGIFSAIPDRFGKLTLPVSHFLPRPGEGFFADRMTLRERLSRKPVNKAGNSPGRLTKVAHRAVDDVEVSRGGHRATGTGLTPLLGWEPIIGLHFPLRNYAQFESNVRRDGRAADPKLRRSDGICTSTTPPAGCSTSTSNESSTTRGCVRAWRRAGSWWTNASSASSRPLDASHRASRRQRRSTRCEARWSALWKNAIATL
jgi:hypothetical protein